LWPTEAAEMEEGRIVYLANLKGVLISS